MGHIEHGTVLCRLCASISCRTYFCLDMCETIRNPEAYSMTKAIKDVEDVMEIAETKLGIEKLCAARDIVCCDHEASNDFAIKTYISEFIWLENHGIGKLQFNELQRELGDQRCVSGCCSRFITKILHRATEMLHTLTDHESTYEGRD